MNEFIRSSLITISESNRSTQPLNKSYVTIVRLAQYCATNAVPYKLYRLYDGWQVCFEKNGKKADFIEHGGSYGHEADLMESMGFDDDFNDVTGYLTVEDAVRKIKEFFEE